MLEQSLSRRDALLAIGASMLIKPITAVAAPVKPALRVVHMTDMHVQPKKQAGEGYAAALDSLRKLDPQPDFIMTGGDHVMDVLNCSRERANEQWTLYHKVLEQGTKLKAYPVVGNHDVYGWSTNPAIPDTTDSYGKAMSRDMLRVARTYYSFDHGAWHFIVIDNIQKRGGGYYGDLDAEQLEWLKGDLQANDATKKPIALFSHIPLASITPLFFNKQPKEFWKTSDALLHRDSRPLIELLSRHGTRLCVSGHIHLLDELRMMGVNFVCDGAVSGSWWGGPHQWVPEGYGVFDLHDDGTHNFQYVTYGWQAAKE